MRRNSKNTRRYEQGGNLWLSFSDLMSSLLLIIILILFYVMYQYFEMYEVNMAEIARQQADLDTAAVQLEEQQATLDTQKEQLEEQQATVTAQQAQLKQQQTTIDTTQTDLDTARAELIKREQDLEAAQTALAEKETKIAEQQTALDEKETQITEQQTALDEKETQIAEQQTALDEKETKITAQQKTLEDQQAQLTTAQTQLTTAQEKLTAQQTQLETQQTQLETQQAQLEQLIGIRPKIISSLSDALKSANIAATVDPQTGAITLKADILFETGQYMLSEAGKATIDSFLPVYLNVLLSEEYEPYLSQIIIEGHTDSRGDYITNLNLSQQRACAVASYVLSDTYTGITAEQREKLRKLTTANGRSKQDPVLDASGVEDMDQSRRVVFKFQLTDEQMVAQMQAILSNQDQ